MSYDLYVALECTEEDHVNGIANGRHPSFPDEDIVAQTRVKLLALSILLEGKWGKDKKTEYAQGKYRSLLLEPQDIRKTPFAESIAEARKQYMKPLGLWQPIIDVSILPPGSWFLQFTFKLAKPYLSRDDDQFHICDNPVRRDKVFKVPMISPSGWKGNLSWTARYLMARDFQQAKEKDIEKLAEERFRLTLLFGDEKGEEQGGPKENTMAEYLAKLDAEADKLYRDNVLRRFPDGKPDELPHHKGCLRFFPTFFDSIGMEIINPHDRKTRAGIQPIDFESVPIDAEGTFSLLYLPFYHLGKEPDAIKKEAARDLELIRLPLKEMMFTYGFSAKKSSGFGIIKEDTSGSLQANGKDPSCDKFQRWAGLEKAIQDTVTALGGDE